MTRFLLAVLALVLCAGLAMGCTHTASATASTSSDVDLVRLAQRERTRTEDVQRLPQVITGHGEVLLPEGTARLPGGVVVRVPRGAPPARITFDGQATAQGEVRHVAEVEHSAQQTQADARTDTASHTESATKAGPPWWLWLVGAAVLIGAGWLLRARLRALLPF